MKKMGYYVIYFLIYAILAMGYTQYATYLSEIGYSISQRGIILSSYAVTTIIFQLFFGFLADKYQMVRRIVIIGIMCFSSSVFFLFSTQEILFFLHLILVALSGGLCNSNMGLIDSWLYAQSDDVSSSYSFIRAFGSLGWGISSVIIAPIIGICGFQGLSILCLFLSIVLCAIILWKDEQKDKVVRKKTSFKIEDLKELFSNKAYLLLVITLFFYYCATSTNNCTVIDKMLSLEASPNEIGLRWSLFGLVEIPIYFIGKYLVKKLGYYKLLVMGGIVITLQFMLFAFANTVPFMIIISCLQMFAGPIVILTSRSLSYQYAPDSLKSTALLVGMSLYSGTTMLFIPMIGGYISELLGVNTMLFIVALLSFAGVLTSLKLMKMKLE